MLGKEAARTWRIGMIGHGLMGKAHANAYRAMPVIFEEQLDGIGVDLACLCGRSDVRAAAKARMFGYRSSVSDWRDLVARDDVDIVDNCGPDPLHVEPTIEAARNGKHVICEKPLARTRDDAARIMEAVRSAGVRHLCSFQFRFIPAIQLLKRLLEEEALGPIHHIQAAFLEDPVTNDGLRQRHDTPGMSGVMGDLASHVIDLLRYLVGEPVRVRALAKDLVGGRAGFMEDVFTASVAFDNGAIASLEASTFAYGHRSALQLAVYGERGSAMFDLASLNHLAVYQGAASGAGAGIDGWTTIDVTGPAHPFGVHWWGPGHHLGWGDIFTNQLATFLKALTFGTEMEPRGATFEDGYRVAVIVDALETSAREGRDVEVRYEPTPGEKG